MRDEHARRDEDVVVGAPDHRLRLRRRILEPLDKLPVGSHRAGTDELLHIKASRLVDLVVFAAHEGTLLDVDGEYVTAVLCVLLSHDEEHAHAVTCQRVHAHPRASQHLTPRQAATEHAEEEERLAMPAERWECSALARAGGPRWDAPATHAATSSAGSYAVAAAVAADADAGGTAAAATEAAPDTLRRD
jgi:hypothetical protein